MDEEKKELKEGEESEEKSLEKNFKEQKEVLRALQRNMSDIKRRMEGIESTLGKLRGEMEETNLSNLFYVFGSMFVAGGLAIIFVTIQTLPKYYSLPLIVGYIIFSLGILMIVSGVAFEMWRRLTKKKHRENDLKEKDCPLSPTDWVMFLSSEIGRVERDRPVIITAIIAVQLAFLGVGVTVGVTHVLEFPAKFKLGVLILCLVFVVVLPISYFLVSRRYQKKVKLLEKIRKDIICGDLTDRIKIRKKWEDATNSSCADKYSIELKKNAKE